MFRVIFMSFVGLSVILMSGCGGDSAANKEPDYEQTKKMVVDILQTEDGKKALSEILSDEEMKQKLIMNSDDVKESVNTVLTSEKGEEMWKKLFEDPDFVKGYAGSMSKEQEKLMKDLMNDADFQKQMLDLLQNPKIDEQMVTILKGQEFRSHLEEVIQQTLETPLFQAKMSEILLKAAEKKNDKEKEDQKDKGKDEGGGGDGGGSGGSSGDDGGTG